MLNLQGKRALVLGVASEESIAWAIAKALHQAGAQIALGYQMRFKSRILQLMRGNTLPIEFAEKVDVTDPQSLQAFFAQLPAGGVDILIHSVAYAPTTTFNKAIYDVSLEEYQTAMAASSFSLLSVTAAALPAMRAGGSIVAMTYLGGQRVVHNYKLMGIAKAALEAGVRELAAELGPQGIRVNAISSGPIKTLAAGQIAGFDSMLQTYEATAPLRSTVGQVDVGNLAAFLASDLSRMITGQVIFVDAGYSILAMGQIT